MLLMKDTLNILFHPFIDPVKDQFFILYSS